MKAPGHAFDNRLFGKDPQPDHMSDFVNLPDTEPGDNGGVHINSGIPNKAFFLTAMRIGGFAWEAPGLIWYESLKLPTSRPSSRTSRTPPTGRPRNCTGTTAPNSWPCWRPGRTWASRSAGSWQGSPCASLAADRNGGTGRENGLATVNKQIGALTAQVTGLVRDVNALKGQVTTGG